MISWSIIGSNAMAEGWSNAFDDPIQLLNGGDWLPYAAQATSSQGRKAGTDPSEQFCHRMREKGDCHAIWKTVASAGGAFVLEFEKRGAVRSSDGAGTWMSRSVRRTRRRLNMLEHRSAFGI